MNEIVTCSPDKTIKMWDIHADESCRRRFLPSKPNIQCGGLATYLSGVASAEGFDRAGEVEE
jgi:hypothetical protein